MTIDEILNFEEMQIFDRKSINISGAKLSDTICAFANADGGTIAIGISDKNKRIEGIDFATNRLNDILRAPLDFCFPSVQVITEKVSCTDYKNRANHILLMHIEASPQLHANHADEVFLRVGDKTKRLNFDDRITLMYDKGLRFFEDNIVADAEFEDIDINFLREYLQKIKYTKSPEEYLKQNKNFVKEINGKNRYSSAAILLFGKNPQQFFPRAHIRFLKYDGTVAKVGTEMNVIKDVVFRGKILSQVEEAVKYLKTQIRERTFLGANGQFVTEEEYPEFVCTEIIVNAVTHRDYSISGTDIQIKMFDDHIEVESPGRLPGLVKIENMRNVHFSRNPKIADFLKNYKYVKEYGEGVDRMCTELVNMNLPVPVFRQDAFMLKVSVYNRQYQKSDFDTQKSDFDNVKAINEKYIAIALQQGYRADTIEKLVQICNKMNDGHIFGPSEIKALLQCADSTAKALMKRLRDMNVVIAVKGQGKGKYRLK